MYELIQTGERSWYVDCPAKIGVFRGERNEVWLIDAGSDKDAGRKLRQIIDREGWTLRAILSTHSHADHIGGNQYLQAQTGCAVYARGAEQAFTRWPFLEPTVLFGGFAPKELHNKFLHAKESEAQLLTAEVLPEGLEMIDLPGHSYEMTGFRTEDGTVFLADCLSSAEVLDKYGIGFLFDVGAYLETLERVKTMEGRIFVPAHAAATEEIRPLAQLNIDKTLEIAERLMQLCREPVTFDVLLQKVFETYGLQMTIQQYALIGCTVRSYLAWLHDGGRMQMIPENNQMLWQSV